MVAVIVLLDVDDDCIQNVTAAVARPGRSLFCFYGCWWWVVKLAKWMLTDGRKD